MSKVVIVFAFFEVSFIPSGYTHVSLVFPVTYKFQNNLVFITTSATKQQLFDQNVVDGGNRDLRDVIALAFSYVVGVTCGCNKLRPCKVDTIIKYTRMPYETFKLAMAHTR
ncbi:hypothetical protein DAPPUDRAFT_318217 [Daphnia pulex]|uniref:Uncharacterized protein n=1 Tax=Daphnia pulex TaxID=6669 RepID=E9GI60_DAPPU|nr:hypothetical protein DAPPUDRAFT_318217 [Daphnia pulex]|eukprot:EFX80620.1 hypothetical protein DAPPUDRAFT_318217 [Daphnia pulex]